MLKRFCGLFIIFILVIIHLSANIYANSPNVIIYEVYTSGGYASAKNNAPYANCYVVLYNMSASPVNLSGYTLCFANGKSNAIAAKTTLAGSIIGNGFYIIKGGACTDAKSPAVGGELGFPANHTDANMHLVRKSGKIALCNSSLGGATTMTSQSPFVVDFLGYAENTKDVDDFKGTPALDVTVKKILRRVHFSDTGNNGEDFRTYDIIDNPDNVVRYTAGMTAVATPTVTMSHLAGYYPQSFNLTLTSNAPGQIVYTVDGSDPTTSVTAKNYGGAIEIKDRTGENTRLMHITGTTPSDITDTRFIWPPTQINNLDEFFRSIFKINTIRTAVKNSDNTYSSVFTNSYIVSDKTIAERFNLPVFSITTDADNLYNPDDGIFIWRGEAADREQKGMEGERPINIEFFETDGTRQFHGSMGMRLNGGYTRRYPQKAMRIYAREQAINYDLFQGAARKPDGTKLTKFKSFVLRAAGNDWYTCAIRDTFGQTYFSRLGTFDIQSYRPAIAFINGEFWGIYDIRERFDDRYFANRYGIAREDVVLLEDHNSPQEGVWGDEKPFKDLKQFVYNNNMSLPENYKRFTDEVDVDNYIDYVICGAYGDNTDWLPGNSRVWRNKNPDNGFDTKWRFLIHDLDYAFRNRSDADDSFGWIFDRGGQNSVLMLKELSVNEEFKAKFIQRLDYLLENFFVPEVMTDFLFAMRDEVTTATPEARARWNLVMSAWDSGYATVANSFKTRNALIKKSAAKNFGIIVDREITQRPAVINTKVDHLLVVNTAGDLYGWGRAGEKQLSPDGAINIYTPSSPSFIMEGVKTVASGLFHTVVVTDGDEVYGWGSNYYGQNGNDDHDNSRKTQVMLDGKPLLAKDVYAGYLHSLVIAQDGKLYGFGMNSYRQVNPNTDKLERTPYKIADNVISAAASNDNTFYITDDNKLYAMGRNTLLGGGSNTVPVMNNAKAVFAGHQHYFFFDT